MRYIGWFGKMRYKCEGDSLQECLRGLRVVRPAAAPDPFTLTATSTPLRHLLRELTTQYCGKLALEILDTLLPPLALVDDEGDTLRRLRRAAREDARGSREERLHAAEVVEQAWAGEEVVSEGGRRRRGGGREEEELQRGEGGEVRPTAWRAVDAVYDHHAVHAAGIVAWEPPSEFARRGGYWVACLDAGLASTKQVDFDVDAAPLEHVTIDFILCQSYFCGRERSREVYVCGGRPWSERPCKSGSFETRVDDGRK